MASRRRAGAVEVVFGPEVFGQRYGGISRYVLELHRRLPALGITSTIAAGAHHNAYLAGQPGVLGMHVPRRLQKERLRPWRERLNDAAVRGYLRGMHHGAIYHQTYYGGTAGPRHSGPYVVSAYDLVHAKFPEHFPSDDPTVAQQREAFAKADLILAISGTTKEDLHAIFDIDPARITVTHLGVTAPPDRPTRTAGLGRPYLLYVGQRYGYKNWERFVHAYASSGLAPDVQVVSAGGSFTRDEIVLIDRLGLSRDIVHVSADDDLLDALYREAAAFVYPSLYEGFGLPPLEAMARGCPVVASSTGSVPEVLGDAALFADPYDVDSLAAALAEAVQPGRRSELSARGRALAATYSWERTAELTAAAYRTLG